MRVGDHELGAAQATLDQAAQERRPERFRLRWPDVQADNLALALGVHRHGDYGGHAGDAPTFALLEVGGIQPQVRPVADQRAVEKGIHPVVDVLAQLGNRALADPCQPHRLHQVVHAPRRHTADPGLLCDNSVVAGMTATRAFSDVRRGSMNGGK